MTNIMWDDLYFKKIVALGSRIIIVKPLFRKAIEQEVTVLFTIDNSDQNIRLYDTEYPWLYRHLRANKEVKKELDNWIETGVLPVWAVKI
jgi:hypothetical protein